MDVYLLMVFMHFVHEFMLCIDYGDSCEVYNVIDVIATLKNVNRLFDPHEDRADSFSATELIQKFIGYVARTKIRENQNVGVTLDGRERVLAFSKIRVKGYVGLHFTFNH